MRVSRMSLLRPLLARRARHGSVRTASTVPIVKRRDDTEGPITKVRGFIEYERNPEAYREPAVRYGELLLTFFRSALVSVSLALASSLTWQEQVARCCDGKCMQ